jgi:hypothetical protein
VTVDFVRGPASSDCYAFILIALVVIVMLITTSGRAASRTSFIR